MDIDDQSIVEKSHSQLFNMCYKGHDPLGVLTLVGTQKNTLNTLPLYAIVHSLDPMNFVLFPIHSFHQKHKTQQKTYTLP